MSKREQTRKEEIVNAITHGLGILFCLIGMPFLLVDSFNANQWPVFMSVLVFGIGMLAVYTFSTLFHAATNQKIKHLFQIGDHISIYFLIAGTYTPLMVCYLKPETATVFLGIMWTIVVFGIIFKIFFTQKFRLISVILYLALGWMIVFVIKPLILTMPFSVFLWILIGGMSYTAGVYFYIRDHKYYYHTVWHFFVLFGTVAHFVSIYLSL